MYNIGAHQVGYSPIHDQTRTAEGDGWVRSVGGHIPETFSKRMPSCGNDPALKESIPDKQAENWDMGTSIDPVVAKALTPFSPPKNRGKKPVQQTFEGMENV